MSDRRRLLAAAAGILLAAVTRSPRAQDPNASAAQRAARDWLALSDELDGRASWEAAGAKFKEMSPVERWSAALREVRAPRGAVLSRAIESTHLAKSIPGLPEGDYAVILFRVSFAKRPSALETVTLEREGGVWRVVGYSIS